MRYDDNAIFGDGPRGGVVKTLSFTRCVEPYAFEFAGARLRVDNFLESEKTMRAYWPHYTVRGVTLEVGQVLLVRPKGDERPAGLQMLSYVSDCIEWGEGDAYTVVANAPGRTHVVLEDKYNGTCQIDVEVVDPMGHASETVRHQVRGAVSVGSSGVDEESGRRLRPGQ